MTKIPDGLSNRQDSFRFSTGISLLLAADESAKCSGQNPRTKETIVDSLDQFDVFGLSKLERNEIAHQQTRSPQEDAADR